MLVQPKVSVIIPVYNVEKHLEECVRSVMAQTLQEIEIICVDDASTDGCRAILRRLAAADPRIVVLSMEHNMTANQARKNGVLASAGEAVMFLDGDDTLVPHACETAYSAFKAKSADVIHYGANVVNQSGVPEARITWNKNRIAPCIERIEGDLVAACFGEDKFFFTLWNKLFRGEVARRAFTCIKDGRFPRAQDLYATFVLLYFSRSYEGIRDVLINYNFGTGITGNRRYDLSSFTRFCQASAVADALGEFIAERNLEAKYGDIVLKLRKNLLTDGLKQWIDHLDSELASDAFDLLADNWEAQELVAALAERHVADPMRFDIRKLSERVLQAKRLQVDRSKKVRTIGIYYHRFHSGGVQRVISLLIPLFMKWGYKVVLITEEMVPEGEYPLPDGVKRVLLPPFGDKAFGGVSERFNVLAQTIKEHKIDVLNHHASSAGSVLFDLLLAKLLGCAVIVSRHELAFSSLLNGTEAPVRQPSVFALADALTVLTRMDEQYYRLMGVRALYVPNPIPSFQIQPVRAPVAPPTIVWVGRMDYVQKQCQEPIEIMKDVVRDVPDAKLLMIGGGWSSGAEAHLKGRIRQLGLESNVEIIGYTPTPETYYVKAACHLITSSWENYPMIVEESRAFGLPIVMYEMPYIEILKSGRGYISVHQSDREAAANAIVRVLRSPSLREEMARAAQEELAKADDELLRERWLGLLSLSRSIENSVQVEDDLLRMLFDNILHLYGLGVRRRNSELSKLRKKIADVERSAARERSQITTVSTSLTRNATGGRRGLDALVARREKYGPIGAIDFLIEIEKSRIRKQEASQ